MDQELSSQTSQQVSKTNPWMVSTLILVGIVVGFGISQVPYLKNVGDQGKASTAVIGQQPTVAQQPEKPKAPVPLTADQVSKLPDDDPFFGDVTAPITVVEFSDFQCPYCNSFYQQSLPLIQENYIKTGKVRLVYRDFPLEIHPQAPDAALASECAHEQGKFQEMHDMLFTNQHDWSGNPKAASMFKTFAQKIGLNTKQFGECMDTQKYNGEIRKDLLDGVALGVNGTPSFFINGKPLFLGAVPYETFFKPIFDAELSGKKWEVEKDDFGRASLKVSP